MSNSGYGYQNPSSTASDFNAITFLVNQMLGRVRTGALVKIISCTNDGGLSPVGFVNVQPMVNMLDGIGNASPHGTIFNLCYFRLQGGTNALICDPVAGDIGAALICDRDISSVKATKAQANPGSFRRFDLSDGLYIGGFLNGLPTQYFAFTSTGIKIADKNGNEIEMKPGSIAMTTAQLTVNGAIIAGFGTGDQVGVQTHEHPTAGTGSPSPPTPGT